ncbi:hypothetical protein CJ672_11235, partial [Arcobacter cryaerophilus gv. occultus]
ARIHAFLDLLNERLGGAYKPKMKKIEEDQYAR